MSARTWTSQFWVLNLSPILPTTNTLDWLVSERFVNSCSSIEELEELEEQRNKNHPTDGAGGGRNPGKKWDERSSGPDSKQRAGSLRLGNDPSCQVNLLIQRHNTGGGQIYVNLFSVFSAPLGPCALTAVLGMKIDSLKAPRPGPALARQDINLRLATSDAERVQFFTQQRGK